MSNFPSYVVQFKHDKAGSWSLTSDCLSAFFFFVPEDKKKKEKKVAPLFT